MEQRSEMKEFEGGREGGGEGRKEGGGRRKEGDPVGYYAGSLTSPFTSWAILANHLISLGLSFFI